MMLNDVNSATTNSNISVDNKGATEAAAPRLEHGLHQEMPQKRQLISSLTQNAIVIFLDRTTAPGTAFAQWNMEQFK
jgi:hypothetical protein